MQNNATSTATQCNPIYASAKLLHSGVLVGALPYWQFHDISPSAYSHVPECRVYTVQLRKRLIHTKNQCWRQKWFEILKIMRKFEQLCI